MPIVRHWFVTDKDGNEVQITSKGTLKAILAQMTPEELARWRAQYRFSPIENDINGIPDYLGTYRDIG